MITLEKYLQRRLVGSHEDTIELDLPIIVIGNNVLVIENEYGYDIQPESGPIHRIKFTLHNTILGR